MAPVENLSGREGGLAPAPYCFGELSLTTDCLSLGCILLPSLFGFLLSLLLLKIAFAVAFDPRLLLLRCLFEFIVVE
jgi:hypothetical protein